MLLKLLYNLVGEIMKTQIIILIRKVREEKHLTLMELSKLSGVSIAHISDIENGKKIPGLQVIIDIAKAMNVRPEQLYKYF